MKGFNCVYQTRIVLITSTIIITGNRETNTRHFMKGTVD